MGDKVRFTLVLYVVLVKLYFGSNGINAENRARIAMLVRRTWTPLSMRIIVRVRRRITSGMFLFHSRSTFYQISPLLC